MEIGNWLNANYPHIIALAAGFALRWGAMRFMENATGPSRVGGGGGGGGRGGPGGHGGGGGKKWGKPRIIKFLTLAFVIFAGLLLAYGAFPLAQWVFGWGGAFAGVIGAIFGVGAIAAGWHALHGMTALVHDMTDGTPDDEAFNAGFWVPTTLPLGGSALISLFTNPRGAGVTGLSLLAISIVTAIFAHKIMDKVNAAEGHYRLWMYYGFFIAAMIGIIHIPGLFWLNQLAGEHLPPWAAWILRAVAIILGAILAQRGLGDWIRDWTPEKWSQRSAMYTIPTFTVLVVSVATLQSNAATSFDRIVGVFS